MGVQLKIFYACDSLQIFLILIFKFLIVMKKNLSLLIFSLVFSVSLLAQTIDKSGNFSPVLTGSKIVYVKFTFADVNLNGNYDCAFALSDVPITTWGDYSVALSAYDEGFSFRNSAIFTQDVKVIPVPGQIYEFWFSIDIDGSTYSVDYRTTGINSPERLATDYAFRKTPVTEINTWSCMHNPDNEPDVITVKNVGEVAYVGAISTLSAVENTKVENNLNVRVGNHTISVLGVNSYEIYNLQGIKIAEVLKNTDEVQTLLNMGVYFVKVGNRIQKVLMK